MRRTDLSRKMNKAISTIEEGVLTGEVFTVAKVNSIVKNEIDLKASKTLESKVTLDGSSEQVKCSITNFKDADFEGTLKKTDIYKYDSKSKEVGIKDINNICGMIQVKYCGNSVELKLIVEAEYIDNNDKKHKVFPCLKSVETILGDDIKDDVVIEAPSEVIEDVVSDSAEEEIVEVAVDEDKNYKDYIGDAITRLFGDRFYGSAPSEAFINVIIDKIHKIYVVGYLEELYTKTNIDDDSSESIQVINRIMDMI